MYTKQLLEDINNVVNPSFFIVENEIERILEEQIQLDENLKNKLAALGVAGMLALGSYGGYKLGQKSATDKDVAVAAKNTPKAEMTVNQEREAPAKKVEAPAKKVEAKVSQEKEAPKKKEGIAMTKVVQNDKFLEPAAKYIAGKTGEVVVQLKSRHFGNLTGDADKGYHVMNKLANGDLQKDKLSNSQKDALAEYIYTIFSAKKAMKGEVEYHLKSVRKDLSFNPGNNPMAAKKVVENSGDLSKLLKQFSKSREGLRRDYGQIEKNMRSISKKALKDVDSPQKFEAFKKVIDAEVKKLQTWKN